jgi:hypothetical protein
LLEQERSITVIPSSAPDEIRSQIATQWKAGYPVQSERYFGGAATQYASLIKSALFERQLEPQELTIHPEATVKVAAYPEDEMSTYICDTG